MNNKSPLTLMNELTTKVDTLTNLISVLNDKIDSTNLIAMQVIQSQITAIENKIETINNG